MNKTVYVVQNPQRTDRTSGQLVPVFPDLVVKAQEWGRVDFLLSPSAAPWSPEKIIPELRYRLAKFDDDSSLLLIGNPILIAMTAMVAGEINHGRVRMLQWNRTDMRYILVEVDMLEQEPTLKLKLELRR